ncbi:Afadin- and alpha-actinin-binding protein [Podochytrium sp. JEL0797]|nr:Afadin- and alpha-actinin-binding protein [Podochytrium sp. JEL0797]
MPPPSAEHVQLVGHMLAANGFSCTPTDLAASSEPVLQALFTLLANAQNELAHRREVDELRQLAEGEARLMAQTLAKTRLGLETADRTNKALCVKADAQESAIKDLSEKYAAAKDEASKATITMNTALAQYKHKSKRKDAEFSALQERLQKMTSEQLHSAKVGIRVVNPSAKRMSAPVKISKSEKHEQDLYAVAITSLEEREKELLLENETIKSCLFSTYSRIKTCISDINKATGKPEAAILSHEPNEEARFHLPFELVREPIELQFQELLDQLGDFSDLVVNSVTPRIDETAAPAAASERYEADAAVEEGIMQLQNEIEEYKMIIEKQKSLIEMALDSEGGEGGGRGSFVESDVLSELEEQKQLIARRSEQLDEERRKFTDAAIRLGRERVQFEKEKDVFEEEKRSAATQHILEQMPDTPMYPNPIFSLPLWLKTKTPAAPRHQPTIPKTPTPALQRRPSNPSTQPASKIRSSTDTPTRTPNSKPTSSTTSRRSSETPSTTTAATTPGYSHLHASIDELGSECATFASTPAVLRLMNRSEVPGDFSPSPAKSVKSVLKKTGTTPPGAAAGSAKRRVVIDVKENVF